MIISIDGTSGSGKSTIAERLKNEIGFSLINTGLLYRLIAKDCIDKEIDILFEQNVVDVVNSIDYKILPSELHKEEISRIVPIIAKYECASSAFDI